MLLVTGEAGFIGSKGVAGADAGDRRMAARLGRLRGAGA